jgi:ATP-dependent Zn protease
MTDDNKKNDDDDSTGSLNRPENIDLFLIEDDAEAPDNADSDANVDSVDFGSARPDVAHELARLVLDAAIPQPIAKRLDARKSIALVLQAPAQDWCAPLKSAVERRWAHCFVDARDGSSRGNHKSTIGNTNVAAQLTSGFLFIGISHNPEICLPSALLTVADARLTVRAPGPKVLRTLLKNCTGGRIPQLTTDAAGLSFDEICIAFRPHSSARETLDRLAQYSASKSRVSSVDATPPLEDLAGYGAAKTWGLELAEGLRAWRRGELAWRDLSSAAVLAGPPGTGKTLFAKALARSCGAPIIVTSVGDWFATTAGHLDDVIKGAQAAWDSARALSASGAILFVDELDGLPDRATLSDRGRDWWTPVINFCLTLFDGAVTDRTGIILLGATNHFDRLDKALVRAGRFDRRLDILPPSPADLAEMLRLHLGDALPDADLLPVASLRPGATGADAARWARDARAAARAAWRDITLADLMGVVAPAETRPAQVVHLAAVHEAGHAVIYLASGLAVRSVSIVETEGTGGVTVARPFDTRQPTAADIERAVIAVLAGRAAEEVFIGQPSAGAEGDLARACTFLAAMHGSQGLGGSLLHLAPTEAALNLLSLDPDLRDVVDAHLKQLYVRSLDMIRAHKRAVEAVAEELIARRMLTGAELKAIVEKTDASIAKGGCDA